MRSLPDRLLEDARQFPTPRSNGSTYRPLTWLVLVLRIKGMNQMVGD